MSVDDDRVRHHLHLDPGLLEHPPAVLGAVLDRPELAVEDRDPLGVDLVDRVVGEGDGRAPGATAPLERQRVGHRLGADRDAADVGDPVVGEGVDGGAEHVDAAEDGGHAGLDHLLAARGRALGGELGVAHEQLERTTADAAQLLVDELDRGLVGLAELGERRRRRVVLVDHAEHDRLTRRLGGLVGDDVGEGRLPRAGQQVGRAVARLGRGRGGRRRGLGLGFAAPGQDGHDEGSDGAEPPGEATRRARHGCAASRRVTPRGGRPPGPPPGGGPGHGSSPHAGPLHGSVGCALCC